MYYYKEVEKNSFVLMDSDFGCIIKNPTTITCYVLDDKISFTYDYWLGFHNLQIEKLDGVSAYQKYHTCSNSLVGETLILLLEALGYKSYSAKGDSIYVGDRISIPVYKLSSTTSIFVSIQKSDENLNKITKLPYYNSDDCFFHVYCNEPTFHNYVNPFIRNGILFVSCGSASGGHLGVYRLGRSLDFVRYYSDIKWESVFLCVIEFLEDYFQSLNIKGRKGKFLHYKRRFTKKFCSEDEATLVFNDYINELIQKRIINKILKL